MSHEKNIDHMLRASQPQLSDFERVESWKVIANALKVEKVSTPARAIVTPYGQFLHTFQARRFVPALLLVLCISVGGTAAVADTAKPGDLLFPVERLTEQVRLSLATETQAEALRSQFAHERLDELETILDEEAIVPSSPRTLALHEAGYDGVATIQAKNAAFAPEAASAGGSPGMATMAMDAGPAVSRMAKMAPVPPSLQVEAHIYRDITMLTIWQDGMESHMTTKARTGAAITAEVAKQFKLDTATVGTSITFITEDRDSRPSERGSLIASSAGEGRVSAAVGAFLDDLEGVDATERAVLVKKMLGEIDGVGVERMHDDRNEATGRIKIKDNRIELRDDGYRVRINNERYGKYGREENSEDQSGSTEPGFSGSNVVSPAVGTPGIFFDDHGGEERGGGGDPFEDR